MMVKVMGSDRLFGYLAMSKGKAGLLYATLGVLVGARSSYKPEKCCIG